MTRRSRAKYPPFGVDIVIYPGQNLARAYLDFGAALIMGRLWARGEPDLLTAP